MVNLLIYDNKIYYSCYSLRLFEIFDSLGFEYIGCPENYTFKHIETNKICRVYTRSDKLNTILAKLKENKEKNLGLSDKEIVDFFKKTLDKQ